MSNLPWRPYVWERRGELLAGEQDCWIVVYKDGSISAARLSCNVHEAIFEADRRHPDPSRARISNIVSVFRNVYVGQRHSGERHRNRREQGNQDNEIEVTA